MDFSQELQLYLKGDIQQSKWMIGIAILLLLPVAMLINKSNLSMQKGLLIPMVFLFVVNISYGGYLLYSKPKYLVETEKKYSLDAKHTMDNVKLKLKAGDASFYIMKYVWACLLVTSVAYYLFLTNNFLKGISLGFIGVFFCFLLIDAFFHQRLTVFLSSLDKSLN